MFRRNYQKTIKQLIILALFLVFLIGALIYYFYYKTQQSLVSKDKNLVTEVEKLIELPTDEAPTIATVLAEDKVSKELFFKNAKVGDKLLAYLKAKKAVLYRPSTNKIIEVAPIVLDSESK